MITAETPTQPGQTPRGQTDLQPVRTSVSVTANQNPRLGCRSFQCPRQAEVVVRFEHELGGAVDPSPDWFWCLGHWPALRDMFHDRGHDLEYSPEALVLVNGARPALPKQLGDDHLEVV